MRLLPAIVGSLILLQSGCGSSTDKTKDQGSAPKATEKDGQPTEAKAAAKDAIIEITAEELGKAFAKSLTEGDKLYQGKRLRIRGKVFDFRSELLGLETKQKTDDGAVLRVWLRFPDEPSATRYKVGETLVVEGELGTTSAFGPALTDFKVIKKE